MRLLLGWLLVLLASPHLARCASTKSRTKRAPAAQPDLGKLRPKTDNGELEGNIIIVVVIAVVISFVVVIAFVAVAAVCLYSIQFALKMVHLVVHELNGML